MENPPPTLDALQARVAALEHRLRTGRIFGTLALAVALAAPWLLRALPFSRLRAEQLQLVDSAWRPLAELKPDGKDRAALRLGAYSSPTSLTLTGGGLGSEVRLDAPGGSATLDGSGMGLSLGLAHASNTLRAEVVGGGESSLALSTAKSQVRLSIDPYDTRLDERTPGASARLNLASRGPATFDIDEPDHGGLHYAANDLWVGSGAEKLDSLLQIDEMTHATQEWMDERLHTKPVAKRDSRPR